MLFKHSDVMAAITTNEVTVFQSERGQCNVPFRLKNTPCLVSHCVTTGHSMYALYTQYFFTIPLYPNYIQMNRTSEKVVAHLLPNCKGYKSGLG